MNNRIDLAEHESRLDEVYELHHERGDGFVAQIHDDVANSYATLIAELKRCYEREDALIEALKIIRDDLDDALETKGHSTLIHEKSVTLQKIRNFANDASE